MDENLIGYLLRALDHDEKRAVEAEVLINPEKRRRLERLQQCLAPLAADAEKEEPRRTLVLDTLALIAEHRCRSLPLPLPPAPSVSPQQVEVPARRWSRRADVLVAALLLVILGCVGTPLLIKQWHLYQRQACVKNLQTFWQALASYSDRHGGAFPPVHLQGPRSVAGIFVPLLVNDGVLPQDVTVLCPALGQRPPPAYTLRELEELSRRDEFKWVAPDLAGSYAYTLGYQDGNFLSRGLHRRDSDLLPILADRLTRADQSLSPNHGGTGQNVLYIGGNVQWTTLRTVGYNKDDIYVNKRNKVALGIDLHDTVLGSSEARPFPLE